MLPILLLEIFYKVLWLFVVAYPLWAAGKLEGSHVENKTSAFLWVLLPIEAVPWGYVFTPYVYQPKQKTDPFNAAAIWSMIARKRLSNPISRERRCAPWKLLDPKAMTITVTREADDQLEPLEFTCEFGADATLEDLTGKLAQSRFLHFSSTCRVLVGRSAGTPLLKIQSRWGSLAAEYLVAADTKLADAVADAAIDFCFERAPTLRPARSDLERRRPVWLALSDLFLDTDVNLLREGNARTLAASPYSLPELDAILREEVYPACSFNLSLVAGEWAGFDADWLEGRILRGGPPPRSWWWRLGRYLTLGWSIPIHLPDEWRQWREDVARLRQQDPAASSPAPAG